MKTVNLDKAPHYLRMLFKKWVEKQHVPYWDEMFAGREAVTLTEAETWLFACIAGAMTSSPHFVLSGHVPNFLCPKLAEEEEADALPTLSATQVAPVTITTGWELKMLELGVDPIPSLQDPKFVL